MSRRAGLRSAAAREDSSSEGFLFKFCFSFKLLWRGRRRREKKAMSLEPNAKKPRIATDSVENEMDEFSAMVVGILSNDPSSQLESIIKFRKFTSLEIPSTENLTKSGVVTRLVEFLEKVDSPKLQYEAASAITNLACDKPEVLIDHGAVPILVQLLSSPNDDVTEQAIWALGYIAGGSIENRDYVLGFGVLVPLLSQLHVNAKLFMLRMATWTLAILCRGKPPPRIDQVKLVLAALEQVLPIYDEVILRHACSAILYLSKGSEEGLRSVIEDGLVPKLVKLLRLSPPLVILPALNTVANIVSGDSQQTQCVINSGALPVLANMLTQDYDKEYDKNIKKLTCWTISNITAGTEEQIQSVIDANLIPILVNLAQNAEFDIKKEALWTISNATSFGSHNQIMYLVGQNCIKPFCDNLLMTCPDPKLLSKCLNGLENILKVGEAKKNTGAVNYYCQLIDDERGQDKIETLRSHNDKDIYEKAMKILDTYWP